MNIKDNTIGLKPWGKMGGTLLLEGLFEMERCSESSDAPIDTKFQILFGQIVDSVPQMWYYNLKHIKDGMLDIFCRRRYIIRNKNRSKSGCKGKDENIGGT